jgi:transposase InsO family protein
VKFSFIHAEKAQFPVAALCRLLGVSRQGYYAFARRGPSPRLAEEEALRRRIAEIHARSRETYGSPRILRVLRAEGRAVGKRRVERLLRSLGLEGCTRRRSRITTRANTRHPAAGNSLDRDFSASQPNQRWVTDITYVWTGEGWCYLAVILDLFSRSVVGWALDALLTTRLPLAALDMAIRRRRPASGLLHHSDRGCQYTSADYREALDELGITVSMSRKGNCWDNAVAESFFATLKAELIYRRAWRARLDLRTAVFEYIEVFYNRERLHSTLGYKSPAAFEQEFLAAA